jgi:hypothetical protein
MAYFLTLWEQGHVSLSTGGLLPHCNDTQLSTLALDFGLLQFHQARPTFMCAHITLLWFGSRALHGL